ncbi:MFS transporter [Paraburkholderia steynii]|uniref:MFS transporter n=1 Tax=Paraburkholderia steynii TaxID=1245441 RepID=A0A4R0XRF5_9BURK|nr:MFS transporter [Paraburkholderia steynii]
MTPTHTTSSLPAPVYWLALGAFAIGTEGFMISPLLPGLATDLSVTVETAGQLVTVFALAYGLSSPVLTALSGSMNRRTLLLASMIAFALSNLLAFAAPSFWALMGARVLLALSAGLYVPGANALASVIVPPERRGRAIAVVNGGITIAIALGVPLGAVIGHALGWRMTFAGVAGLAALAVAGLFIGLPRDIGAGIPVATLLTTTLWATGAYTVYTYLSPFLAEVTGLAGAQVGMVMFMWGLAAAIGVVSGGTANDRFGPLAVIVPTIALSGLAFATLSISARFLSPGAALVPVIAAIALWGVAHWAFYPAQQARLIDIAGVKVASIVLSLNASFMYIGFSIGAALGALTLAHASVGSLGWVAAICELAAVLLTVAIIVRPVRVNAACAAVE